MQQTSIANPAKIFVSVRFGQVKPGVLAETPGLAGQACKRLWSARPGFPADRPFSISKKYRCYSSEFKKPKVRAKNVSGSLDFEVLFSLYDVLMGKEKRG